MPPSPAMRFSPGMEVKGENHKRGRSLEGGILFREKDDDLLLFSEMQSRETDDFLLQTTDDFEDTFSTKLRYFSDFKLGLSIPARGESSDLLNADGEKNDYEWLLTPPDTPLFPSLDDDTPPVTLLQRGRPRSQPITISRSSTMERSHRSSRGSPSPNRLSPSPRSGSSTSQVRGRQSSAQHSSPSPSSRHTTPSRRPSPPPGKPSPPRRKLSTSAPRPSTPTPRRMSTGSGVTTSSGIRGASPVRTARGNSASPKINAWQTNLPGFSLEAPPNLRTSLGDRPASYVRGSSPASKNGRDSSRSGRQSMSPTPSRSVSSSFSHDRDHVSSNSKGSIASSGDDDLDSLQSVPISSMDHSSSNRVGGLPTNRGPSLSKKTAKPILSSSAPKRSFDLALRQMDNRKGPQNMFRPLLSSVPSSTFYVGKSSTARHALISTTSSVTTSSNASSDQGAYGALDTDVRDRIQDKRASECIRATYLDAQEGVFSFEKEDTGTIDKTPELHHRPPNVEFGELTEDARTDTHLVTEAMNYQSTVVESSGTSKGFEIRDNFPEVDYVGDCCSRCGCRYDEIESNEEDLRLCPDCRCLDATVLSTTIVSEICPNLPMEISGEDRSFDVTNPLVTVSESSEWTHMAEIKTVQHDEDFDESQTPPAQVRLSMLPEDFQAQTKAEEDMSSPEIKPVTNQATEGPNPTDDEDGAQPMQSLSNHASLKLNVLEGAGMSILLKRSTSVKGPVIHSRALTATTISYDDLSYMRSSSSMRSSQGHGSRSASSSVDLGSTRQTDFRMQRQLSGRKSDIETRTHDISSKHQQSESSFSGSSGSNLPYLDLTTGANEQKLDASVTHLNNEVVSSENAVSQEQLTSPGIARVDDPGIEIESNNYSGNLLASTSELPTHGTDIILGDSSIASLDSASYGNDEDFKNDKSISSREESPSTPEPSNVETGTIDSADSDRVDVPDVPTQCSLDTIAEIEIESADLGSPGSQSDVVSSISKSSIDEIPELPLETSSDKDVTCHAAEDALHYAHVASEESTVTVGLNSRSLTLEEATDTILFCSSIVHNLAYEAATIAMEKEKVAPLEGSRPMVTILGNSNSNRHQHGRTVAKRTPKSQKARQRRVAETDTKNLSSTTDSDDENVNVSTTTTTRMVGVSEKPDSMKPPKLESKCNCIVM